MRDGSVFLTEIEAKRVLRVTPDAKIKVVAQTDPVPAHLRGGSIQRIGAIPVAVGGYRPFATPRTSAKR